MTNNITTPYRQDIDPNCIHCSNYDYSDDICIMESEDESLTYPSCNKFSQRHDDYCEYCGKPYDPKTDEDHIEPDGFEEFWGAIVSRPAVLVGFTCSDCGEYTEFT